MAALPEEERENTKAITRSVNFNKPLLRRDYPTTAFPLFLTSLQYLQIVDGTLETPFYPRNADGSIRKDESDEAHFDVDGMDLLVMLDVLDDESDSDDSVLGIILEGEGEDESHSVEEEPHLSSKVSRQRVHMTYHVRKITNPFRYMSLKTELEFETMIFLCSTLKLCRAYYVKGNCQC